jgi:hypothetical protein
MRKKLKNIKLMIQLYWIEFGILVKAKINNILDKIFLLSFDNKKWRTLTSKAKIILLNNYFEGKNQIVHILEYCKNKDIEWTEKYSWRHHRGKILGPPVINKFDEILRDLEEELPLVKYNLIKNKHIVTADRINKLHYSSGRIPQIGDEYYTCYLELPLTDNIRRTFVKINVHRDEFNDLYRIPYDNLGKAYDEVNEYTIVHNYNV